MHMCVFDTCTIIICRFVHIFQSLGCRLWTSVLLNERMQRFDTIFFDFVYWGITSFYNDYISTHFSLLAKPQNCKYWEETNKFITTCLFLCLFYQYPYIWRQWQMLEQIQDICIFITCTDIIIHLSVSPWYFLLYILVYYTVHFL